MELAGNQYSIEPDSSTTTRPTLTLVRAGKPSVGWYDRFGKRTLDLVVSAVFLIALLPLLAMIWLTLRFALGRDVVIAQDRVGRGGRTFSMYKFRTMRWSRRAANGEFPGEERRLTHKADHDPRHTTVGRAFRKLSLDELPQLLNVLRGDMSLVGPRPELAVLVDGIDERRHLRHSVRPGITGEWQISTRQQGIPLHECFDGDLPYLGRITLGNDMAILARTVGVVAGRGGR